MKTIDLKGKQYAPVSARIEALHEEIAKQDGEDKSLVIDTQVKFEGEVVITKAVIRFYRGEFTAHAYGRVGKEKALEKLETVAVGRALAFAGYLAGGEIASYDEIEEFSSDNGIEI